jgi:RNA polymerase sigma-70 factor, ECF subfamily
MIQRNTLTEPALASIIQSIPLDTECSLMAESDDLIERCRSGDQDAARVLFDSYVERLLPLARRRISQRLNSRVDAEDIVQSVFRTFFARLKDDKFEIGCQDDLFRLLVRITVHKTLRQIAHHKAAKRDPGLEMGQSDSAHEQLLQLLTSEPTPEATVSFLDQLEHFMSQLPEADRKILELRMEGFSTEEIAQKIGSYDRKVRRVLERIRDVAEHEGLAV